MEIDPIELAMLPIELKPPPPAYQSGDHALTPERWASRRSL